MENVVSIVPPKTPVNWLAFVEDDRKLNVGVERRQVMKQVLCVFSNPSILMALETRLNRPSVETNPHYLPIVAYMRS